MEKDEVDEFLKKMGMKDDQQLAASSRACPAPQGYPEGVAPH